MIYVTGDLHGDFERFQAQDVRKLKKGDTLLVCGDFGFLWEGGKEEEKLLKKIGKLKFQTLFIPGCHDNYALLGQYPEEDFCGGRARHISGNLWQLCRGYLFDMEGLSVFAFGGGTSDDTALRMEQGKWWEEEQPTQEQIQQAASRLAERENKVDFIISHDVPTAIADFIHIQDADEVSFTNAFLERVREAVEFQTWYFGKFHMDKHISTKFQATYQKVFLLGGEDVKKAKKAKKAAEKAGK